MRMRDSKKVGMMGIIQPKMLFSRIRIWQASGLDSCLDSHSWLRVVSLDLYLMCHRLFATPTKAVGANQARSWDGNSINGISKISIFGLRLLNGWFCQDCAGMCLTQTVSRISRRAAGKSVSTLKKLRAYQKLGCHTTGLQWPVREEWYIFLIMRSLIYLGCWLLPRFDWRAQMNFDGVEVNWTPWAYLYRKGRGSQRWCYSFQANSDAVLGV